MTYEGRHNHAPPLGGGAGGSLGVSGRGGGGGRRVHAPSPDLRAGGRMGSFGRMSQPGSPPGLAPPAALQFLSQQQQLVGLPGLPALLAMQPGAGGGSIGGSSGGPLDPLLAALRGGSSPEDVALMAIAVAQSVAGEGVYGGGAGGCVRGRGASA